MAIKDILKVNRKTFFNPKAWLDYDSVKQNTRTVVNLYKGAFVKPKDARRKETFDEAVKRMKLTQADLEEAEKNYYFFAMVFGLIGVIILVLGFIFLIKFYLLGFLLSLAMCAVLFAQAFRNHFLYFQMKHRKLGCTIEEWRQGKTFEEQDQ